MGAGQCGLHPDSTMILSRLARRMRGCHAALSPRVLSTFLGIETSCDDTAVAVVTENKHILSNEVSSQFEEFMQYGGIRPNIAARAHEQCIDQVLDAALSKAGVQPDALTGVAVTAGPGLAMCLSVGVSKAREFAALHNLPLVAVNHLEGHALAVQLTQEVEFPFMVLLVSGGHTQMLMCYDVGSYELLGSTSDDAIGEAFDKVARVLNIVSPYHSGQALEESARNASADCLKEWPFTIPMRKQDQRRNLMFSFAGLKSQVARAVSMKKGDDWSERDTSNVAYAFQHVAFAHVMQKLELAINRFSPKMLVVSGGVARNQFMRDRLDEISEKHSLSLAMPPPSLCCDNGAMIAWAGIERYRRGWTTGIEEIDFFPRWPLSSKE